MGGPRNYRKEQSPIIKNIIERDLGDKQQSLSILKDSDSGNDVPEEWYVAMNYSIIYKDESRYDDNIYHHILLDIDKAEILYKWLGQFLEVEPV